MTKVTILGQDEPKKELKKIEGLLLLNEDGKWVKDTPPISEWDNCMLLERNGYKGMDLFIVWDNNSNEKFIFLGHFNDGIV